MATANSHALNQNDFEPKWRSMFQVLWGFLCSALQTSFYSFNSKNVRWWRSPVPSGSGFLKHVVSKRKVFPVAALRRCWPLHEETSETGAAGRQETRWLQPKWLHIRKLFGHRKRIQMRSLYKRLCWWSHEEIHWSTNPRWLWSLCTGVEGVGGRSVSL